jgi:hypothetical protein
MRFEHAFGRDDRLPWNAPSPLERHCQVITERAIADAVIDNCEE